MTEIYRPENENRTLKLIRLTAAALIVLCAAALIYILATLIKTWVTGIDVPGYASLLCIVLFLGGTIQLSVGIVGEYVAHIYLEAKDRPIYVLKESSLPDIARKTDGEDRA